MDKVRKGYYQHYKGQHYQVLDVGLHSESKETMVIYRALYGDFGIWLRPVNMFSEDVMVEGKKVPRFRFIKADE